MRRARQPLAAIAALAIVLMAAPAIVLSADAVTLTGIVRANGQPAAAATVVATVTGTDIVVATATDEQGAFSADLEAGVGTEVTVVATGQTVRTGPDARGCVRSETPTGRTTITIEGMPPAPVEVTMDQLITSTVCSATASRRPTAQVTPPATDAGGRATGSSGAGLLLVLGALALTAAGSLVMVPRRR